MVEENEKVLDVNNAEVPVEQPVQTEYAEAVQPVEQPVQTEYAEAVQPAEEPVQTEYTEAVQPAETEELIDNDAIDRDINENPMGKVKLNNEVEEEHEYIDPKTIKLDFKGNKNLMFVILLGVLLLVAVILLPIILF